MRAPWKPSDPARWSILGLADPDAAGRVQKTVTVADALAYGLVLPGVDDPIEGIVRGVHVELAALAELLQDRPIAEVLLMLNRRLETAMLLLSWCDNREKLPVEDGGEPPDSGGAP